MAVQAVTRRTIAAEDFQSVQHALYQLQPELPQSIASSRQLRSYRKGSSNLLTFHLTVCLYIQLLYCGCNTQ